MKVYRPSFISLIFTLLCLIIFSTSFYYGSITIPKFVLSELNVKFTKVFAVDGKNNTDFSLLTNTPIKHLIVIFPENTAFDHYFGTYPKAKNLKNEPQFNALPNTPSVNNLTEFLLNNNTNFNNPFRFDRLDSKIVAVCDNDHEYSAIQESYNGGLLNNFVNKTEIAHGVCKPNQSMGYFDGNTVTALWNYAQHFAMSDNFYSTNFGASLAGHINLISGQTHGVIHGNLIKLTSNGTLIGDPDSAYDDCSNGTKVYFTGQNIGDKLNEKNISWGWFEGGFKPTKWILNNTDNISKIVKKAVCGSKHLNIAGNKITDYVVHHEPFQYYASTANPHHLPPSTVNMIGHTDQSKHQYDLSDFWNAIEHGNLPAISFLKPSQYQTGHPGYSDPIDEQNFTVNIINELQRLNHWNNTAIIIAYDDSGGWYNHVMPPIVSQSNDLKYDRLLGHDGLCGHVSTGDYQDRCGYGGRLPLLIVSPVAKINYVSHQISDQTSILRFIEDNWNLGRMGNHSFDSKAGPIDDMFNFTKGHYAHKLFLNPNGTVNKNQ